jgi:hypothetical protein
MVNADIDMVFGSWDAHHALCPVGLALNVIHVGADRLPAWRQSWPAAANRQRLPTREQKLSAKSLPLQPIHGPKNRLAASAGCSRLHVTPADMKTPATTRSKPSRDKVRAHRKRLRQPGLRPIQIWVADVRSPAFVTEAHRQSRAVANSSHARRDQNFIDAIADGSGA